MDRNGEKCPFKYFSGRGQWQDFAHFSIQRCNGCKNLPSKSDGAIEHFTNTSRYFDHSFTSKTSTKTLLNLLICNLIIIIEGWIIRTWCKVLWSWRQTCHFHYLDWMCLHCGWTFGTFCFEISLIWFVSTYLLSILSLDLLKLGNCNLGSSACLLPTFWYPFSTPQ